MHSSTNSNKTSKNKQQVVARPDWLAAALFFVEWLLLLGGVRIVALGVWLVSGQLLLLLYSTCTGDAALPLAGCRPLLLIQERARTAAHGRPHFFCFLIRIDPHNNSCDEKDKAKFRFLILEWLL